MPDQGLFLKNSQTVIAEKILCHGQAHFPGNQGEGFLQGGRTASQTVAVRGYQVDKVIADHFQGWLTGFLSKDGRGIQLTHAPSPKVCGVSPALPSVPVHVSQYWGESHNA